MPDFNDIGAFLLVARASGFRQAARASGMSSSALSDAIKRLENELGVRLLNRTTRSVLPTEAGAELLRRVDPAFAEIRSALDQISGDRDRVAGSLKLNVPVSAARLVLPDIVPPFLAAYPDIRLEILTDENFVDIISAGCDAGIRYDERLEQDMIAVPIGPRAQRFALAAAPGYIAARGRPTHPRELLEHACIRGRFAGRAIPPWEFERDGETMIIDPPGQLLVQSGGGTDLGVSAAIAGMGVIYLFEDWLEPHLASGALEPLLEPWWLSFSGPYLYYPGRRLVPAPLRAFIDFVKGGRKVE
ncbi:LysR family transcriptional regulator [Agrobacterium fabrum]|uniref:LysR family transcriptional regulator n=1 Tax=Agrobacterium fabrum TaxID=1176649 RepID=UPI0009BBD847|nr:LysR family transcriptional regulator [Agrobacterium fabrum]WCK78803.1 LysR family transcriptional regulator [Agrobacterium fabrum]WIE29866.1 LysR family transcriptional regulator [Agrobacterium fabrum]WIE45826.1 LysR family transcriptional regulator [Agrobacterium fabrum]CUX44507.1 putative transcriptional regulator, LysR family [Agrobacterium fabrum str. J-07]